MDKYNLKDKPILLKDNIIKKNLLAHPDIKRNTDIKNIFANSLYKPELVLPANKEKPVYHNFISRIGEDKNSIVLLELSEEKENYEIVNYHWLGDNAVKRKVAYSKNT